MKKTEIKKVAYSAESGGRRVITSGAGYPQIEGCEKINAFYAKCAEKLSEYTADFGKRHADAPARTVRILPMIRYSDDERLDVTFDVMISEKGRLLFCRRYAHCWALSSQRLMPPVKKGAETFFDGEKYIAVENLFGTIETRRISEYVRETEIKNPRG